MVKFFYHADTTQRRFEAQVKASWVTLLYLGRETLRCFHRCTDNYKYLWLTHLHWFLTNGKNLTHVLELKKYFCAEAEALDLACRCGQGSFQSV